jgi:hypothetical protein
MVGLGLIVAIALAALVTLLTTLGMTCSHPCSSISAREFTPIC